MKILLPALALTAFAGAAIAQEVAPPAPPAPPAAPAPPAPPAAPANPEKDARGIPVVSAPAVAPSGANAPVEVPAGATVTVAPNQASVFTPTAATGDLPACSKTVTDRCKQTYERKK